MTACPQKQPRVLIVDDDPAIIKALSHRCEKMGFSIDTACNGVQMVLKARRTAPDLVIVDVNMPELDGLTASLHLLQPGGHPMDVIVVSGSSNGDTVESCEAMGMFYARKGPDFWRDIRDSLIEIFPHMADAIAAQSAGPAGAPDTVPNRPRVLIIDDDQQIGVFLASRLNKHGIETLYAPNVVQAMRIAVKRSPSVIITDYCMPEGDARFLMSRLRGTQETANIPVIVLSEKDIDRQTAGSLTRDIQGHAGVVRIFKKSFDFDELFQAIQEFCAFEPGGTPQ